MFLGCCTFWISLRDKWLEMQVCHFVAWLRFAKNGFVRGYWGRSDGHYEGIWGQLRRRHRCGGLSLPHPQSDGTLQWKVSVTSVLSV